MPKSTLPLVLLAGGLATRLRPITASTPKALIPINGVPFIDWQLKLLRSKGITKVIMCLGFLGEEIEEYVGSGSKYGLEISYSYDGGKLLGTGGAIKKALKLLPTEFFVTYGDSYLEIDYQPIQAHYKNSHKKGLMVIYPNKDKWDTSNVVVEQGQIKKYSKTDKDTNMDYIDYGITILTKDMFNEQGETFDLGTILEEQVKNKELAAYVATNRFYEIGSVAGIQALSEKLQ